MRTACVFTRSGQLGHDFGRIFCEAKEGSSVRVPVE